MLTIETLQQFGADTEDGLKRCMNLEDFYLELVQTALDDTPVTELEKAISAQDLDSAFETAHAFKGVCGNLALTPLYIPVSEITELLRSRTQTDYQPLMTEIKLQMQKLRALAE